ncbi:MAG: hypothetical protein AAFR78_08415, partial [Planctomycetota bacterium]
MTTITAVSHTMADDVDDLIRELNATSAAQGTDDIKSWREVFGIEEIALAVGWSMGGQQAFQWASA